MGGAAVPRPLDELRACSETVWSLPLLFLWDLLHQVDHGWNRHALFRDSKAASFNYDGI